MESRIAFFRGSHQFTFDKVLCHTFLVSMSCLPASPCQSKCQSQSFDTLKARKVAVTNPTIIHCIHVLRLGFCVYARPCCATSSSSSTSSFSIRSIWGIRGIRREVGFRSHRARSVDSWKMEVDQGWWGTPQRWSSSPKCHFWLPCWRGWVII